MEWIRIEFLTLKKSSLSLNRYFKHPDKTQWHILKEFNLSQS